MANQPRIALSVPQIYYHLKLRLINPKYLLLAPLNVNDYVDGIFLWCETAGTCLQLQAREGGTARACGRRLVPAV